jgi:hypothetical protein
MHVAAGAVAEIRALWCPGNIALASRAPLDKQDLLPSRGRRNVAADSDVIQRSSIEAEEVAMRSFKTSLVRPAWLALAFVATALPASAQTWINEPDVPRARVYEPRAYYEPRVYESPAYESPDYAPVVSAPPVALTPAQRTTIYRTIIPQGRGRGPIVREQIVTESVAKQGDKRVIRNAEAEIEL